MKGSVVVLLMGTVCAVAIGAEPARGPNLVPNGGFEADTAQPGFPDGWTLTVKGEDPLLKGELSREAHSGRYSFCVAKAPGRRGTTLGSPTLSSTPLELKPRVTYQIRFWMKMESPFPFDGIGFRVKTNTPGFRGARPFDFDVTREWQPFTIEFLTEADTTTGTLEFFNPGDLADRLYIDDVAVRETTVAADPNLPLCYHPWLPPPAAVHRTDLADFTFPPDRPRVEHTAAELEEMRREAGDNLSRHARVREAEPWLTKPLHFFEEGVSYIAMQGVACPADSAQLKPFLDPDGAHGMECPKCGKRYTEEPHKHEARRRFTPAQATGARALGRAYALTGDERYARRAAEILLGFADRYRQWGGGTRPTLFVLQECWGFLVPCASAYDYIYNWEGLSAEEHRKIEEGLLRPGADHYLHFSDSNGRMNNRGPVFNEAVFAIGSAINDKGYLDHALNSPYSGFHAMLAGWYDKDGMCPEGFDYHTVALVALSPMAEKAYRLGINVYRDPMCRKVFDAPLSVLLPGEALMTEQYQIACRRLAELGQPMEYPFGEDKMERATRLPSTNFADRGYGVLRSGEGADHIYLSMTYGQEAMWYGHCHNRKLSLLLYANGRPLTPRGRAARYDHALAGWSETALANNTMTVDDRDNRARSSFGTLVAFEAAPRVKVLRAADDGAYPGVTLDRTLFLADGYAVDLAAARARSGEHRFDLCYRLFGMMDSGLPFRAREGALGAGYGYEYLTDVRSARTGEGWAADWRQPGDSALRLSLVGAPGTEVNACASPVNADSGPYADADQKETVDALLVRRRGRGTVFAAVWEPYRDRPGITRAMALPVEGGEARGVGVEVTREGRPGSACFLAAYTPGRRRFGDIELDGKLAAGRWRDPQAAPEYAALINGVLLRRGPRSLEASAPATLYVEQLAPDQLLMKIGSESAGTLTLVGSVPGTVTVERDGQRVEATAARERSLTFQAAADASYRVSGVTDWQSIRLACEAPAREDAVQPAAAKPLETAVRAEPGIQSPLPGKNQIANAGFEVNLHTRGDLASPWEQRNSYYFAWFGTGHDYDGEVAHTGRHSARISRAQSGQVTLRGGIEQKFSAAAAGKTYTLSAWLKAGVDPTRVRLVLYGWNPKWGRDFEGGVSPEFTIGTEWQRITWTRTFGPEVTDAYAMTVRPYQVMGGDIWIDDVQVEEGAEATDFAPDAWSARAQKETPGQPLSR